MVHSLTFYPILQEKSNFKKTNFQQLLSLNALQEWRRHYQYFNKCILHQRIFKSKLFLPFPFLLTQQTRSGISPTTVPDNNRQSGFSPTTVPKLSTGKEDPYLKCLTPLDARILLKFLFSSVRPRIVELQSLI